MPGPISAMGMRILREQMEQDPEQYKQEPVMVERPERGLSPQRLHTIGGLADAAGTYYFAKRGTGAEGNPLLSGIQNPELLGLGAVGGLVATKAIAALIRKKYPKVADALSANLGAEQLGVGVNNVGDKKQRSTELYMNTLSHHLAKK